MVTVSAGAMAIYGLLLIYDCVLQAYRVGFGARNLSLAALGLVFIAVYGAVAAGPFAPTGAVGWLAPGLCLLACVFLFGFACYLVATVVVVRKGPRDDWRYVAVLGAGLTQGRYPSRLLRGRLDAGIRWWREPFPGEGAGCADAPEGFAAATAKHRSLSPDALDAPESQRFIVVCGGQGPDEQVSEAQAMAEYLTAHGVPADRILLEDLSRTTAENLENARVLIEAHESAARLAARTCIVREDIRCLIVTSSFHAVRTALWARRSGICSVGVIGKPTRKYYLVGALVRDYLALIKGYRVPSAAIAAGCLALGAGLAMLP